MRIFINAKFRTNKIATGVDRVANAYFAHLRDNYAHVELLTFKSKKVILKNIEEQFFFQSINKIRKSDVVIHPTNMAPMRKLGCFEILVLHDLIFADHPSEFNFLFRKWYQFVVPHLLKSKDLIVTVSHFSKQRIIDHYKIPEEKVKVILNGVDAVYEKSVVRKSGVKHFLMVGSITERKNHYTAIEAHKLLSEEIRAQFPLVIVGGRNHNFLLKEGGNLYDECIRFTGFVSDSELEDLYDESVAVVSPSIYEGFGLPVIEAFARGRHVICSDIEPFIEILGKSYEFYFTPDDVHGLAALMSKCVISINQLYSDVRITERLERAQDFLWRKSLIELDSILEGLP